jgi:hypothetical protein
MKEVPWFLKNSNEERRFELNYSRPLCLYRSNYTMDIEDCNIRVVGWSRSLDRVVKEQGWKWRQCITKRDP